MPTYDYKCSECAEQFEVRRSFSETRDEMCPACGAEAKRVFTPAAVVFKGSGFHNTDYKPRPKESESSGSCPSKAEGSSKCSGCPAAE